MRQSFLENSAGEQDECVKYGIVIVLIFGISLKLPDEFKFGVSLVWTLVLISIFCPIIYIEFQKDWNNFQEDRRDVGDIIIRMIITFVSACVSFMILMMLMFSLANTPHSSLVVLPFWAEVVSWILFIFIIGSIARTWMNVYSLLAITINYTLNLLDYFVP